MGLTAPTAEEIAYGYDKITEDGPSAEITLELSVLALRNPQLADTIRRMMTNKIAREAVKDTATLQAVIMGALIYGLHLGLHIGEARRK